MQIEKNILRRYDFESLTLLEDAFDSGPLAGAASSAPSIERRSGLSPEAFARDYRAKDRPVVLTGYVEEWPAVRNWSFAHLAETVASVEITIDITFSARSRKATMAEFVELLQTNTGPNTTPMYLQEWLYTASAPQLGEDIPELEVAQYDFRRELYGDAAATSHQLWLGQKGAITRFHRDSYSVDVMHAQIVGSKRWYVMGPRAQLHRNAAGAPDFEALIDSPDTALMVFDLEPGDFLFLPANFYHRVVLLADSIGLARKALDVKNLGFHMHQRMAELLGLLLNYDEVSQTHPELVPVVMARSRVLADRMRIDLSNLRP